jgi:outer membrane lipoprotein-sorting protein
MKKKFTIVFTFISLFVGHAVAQDQDSAAVKAEEKTPTAAEIIARYSEAIGGREAHRKVKTRISEGKVSLVPMNIEGVFTSYAAAPNKVSNRLNLSGLGDILDGFDGSKGWTVNPLQGSRERKGDELKQAQLIGDFYRESELDRLYSRFELKGNETVNGKSAYVITAYADGLPAETLYFDVESGLLLRSDSTLISPEGRQQTSTYYSDYREVDGLKLPFSTRTVLPQFEIVVRTDEIRHNVKIDDAVFSQPVD